MAAGALFLVVCGSESSSSSDEVAALQAQVDEARRGERTAQGATGRFQYAEQQPKAPQTEPETTEPARTPRFQLRRNRLQRIFTRTTEAVVSLLSFNGVDPASFPDATPGEITIYVSVVDRSVWTRQRVARPHGTALSKRSPASRCQSRAVTLQEHLSRYWLGPRFRRANPHRPGPVGNRIGRDGCRRSSAGHQASSTRSVDVQSDTEFIGGVSVPKI